MYSSVEEPRRTARRAVALEPAHRLHLGALLVGGQSHPEATEEKDALGVGEGSLVLPGPVDVALPAELAPYGVHGGARAWVAGR